MTNPLFSSARKPRAEVNWQAGLRWTLFAIIMLTAAWFRLWRLDEIPPAIFRDEAEKALNGWFLLHGGVDAAGRPWPIFIKVFGVTTSAIYQYATIPFLAIGGLNEWTARLPAACIGIATVALTWALVRRLWGWQAAAWAAGLLAISPWHVPLSRWAQQGIFLPFFFTAAVWAVAHVWELHASNNKIQKEEPASHAEIGGKSAGDDAKSRIDGHNSANINSQTLANINSQISPAASIPKGSQSTHRNFTDATWLALAGACIGLAMYTYDPARLFAPLLAIAAAVIWWPVWIKKRRAVFVGIAAFLLCVSPVIWLMLNQGDAAMARFKFLSIAQPGLSATEIAWQFLRNYASHFSLTFLLFSGDAELRHSAGIGMFSFTELILIITGILFTIINRNRWAWFFVIWVLLAPVPASLTREGVPHALRSQMALPACQILAAFGVIEYLKRYDASWRKKKDEPMPWFYKALLPMLVFSNFMTFDTSYFDKYPQKAVANWQYGVKQALQYLNEPATRNSQVIFKYVTGAEYLVPFYLEMDLSQYRRMLAGQTRYQFADPRTSLENWLSNPPDTPRAVVTPMGVPRIEGSYNMFIDAPGGQGGSRAVMQIFRSPELMEQIKAGAPVEAP